MIEAEWNASAFTRRVTAAVKRAVSARSKGAAGLSRANRWRRADLLWPDIAPRYKD